MISNPPYGERLGERDSACVDSTGSGAKIMLREFAGWQGALLTTEKELGMATGLRSRRRYTLYNGSLACSLLLFDLDPDKPAATVPLPKARSV